MTALKAGRRCSSCAQPLAAAADWKYCRTGWNKPRMSVTDRQMQSFPRLSDYPHEQTHLHNEMHLERLEWWKQSFSILTTPRGSAGAELSRDQAQSLPWAQDPAGRCCQCQGKGQNSKPKQLPGMQWHQDSWIQPSPEPSGNSPHSESTEWGCRNFTCAVLQGWVCTQTGKIHALHSSLVCWNSRIIQIYFSPSNDFNRLLNKTSSPSPAQWDKPTFQFLAEWDKKQRQSQFPCNNSHQVSSGMRGLSLLLPRWHQCVCCYRSPAQHCNGKLLKEFLSPSLSSSILTAKTRNTSNISLNIKIGTYLAKICLYRLHSLPTTTGGLQKKRSRFPKKQQLANFIIPVFFCTAWHSNQTKLLITACEREGIRDFRNWAVASLMELKLYQPCTQKWRKRENVCQGHNEQQFHSRF